MRRRIDGITSSLLLFFFLSFSVLIVSSRLQAEDLPLSLKEKSGRVEIQRAGEAAWRDVNLGDALHSGDKIRTLLASSALLLYPDESSLLLKENSVLEIHDTSVNPRTKLKTQDIRLNLGGLKYKVTKMRERGSDFKIHSSTAIVGITGTEGVFAAQGEDKPTSHVLWEGKTIATDALGQSGRLQKAGNTFIANQEKVDFYQSTSEEKEAKEFSAIPAQMSAALEELKVSLQKKQEEGFLLGDLWERLDGIQKAVYGRRFSEAEAKIAEFKKALEGLKVPSQAAKLSEDIKTFRKELQAKETEGGYELRHIYQLVHQMDEAYQGQDFNRAKDILLLARQEVSRLEKSGVSGDFSVRYQKLLGEIVEKEKEGFIVEDAKSQMRKASLDFAAKDGAGAEDALSKARSFLQTATRRPPESLEKELESLRAGLETKKTEGYDTKEAELSLEKARQHFSSGEFADARLQLAELRDRISRLRKPLPQELALRLQAIQAGLDSKKKAGFAVRGLADIFLKVQEAQEQSDFAALAKALTEAEEELARLTPPESLHKRIEDFRARLKEKQQMGFAVQGLLPLEARISASLQQQDLITCRRLLEEAEKTLLGLADIIPPSVQLADLVYQEGSVVVSGVARDNVKVELVKVNQGLATLDEEGRFKRSLLLGPNVAAIEVQAVDTSGNLSPLIRVSLADPPGDEGDREPPVIPQDQVKLEYVQDGVVISGKVEPGATVTAQEVQVYCDDQGDFALKLSASEKLVQEGLNLVAQDRNGNQSEALHLAVEDRWPPTLQIARVDFTDAVPPSLVAGLEYGEEEFTVKGQSQDTATLLIEGSVQDLGLGLKELRINGLPIEVKDDGTFKYNYTLGAEGGILGFRAEDKAGNRTDRERPIDIALAEPLVTVNRQEVLLDKEGRFNLVLSYRPDLNQVTVEAQDDSGNSATPVILTVADRIPPPLTVGDVVYGRKEAVISGGSEPFCKVYDQTKQLFAEQIEMGPEGTFSQTLARPSEKITGSLVAEDPAGNVSPPVAVTIEPLVDTAPPELYVEELDFSAGKVVVKGSASDDAGVESVKVNGEVVATGDGPFKTELKVSDDLKVIEVVAEDISGKSTTVKRVVEDKEKPDLKVEEPRYEAGYIIVNGEATDNVGLKSVTVNDTPVEISFPQGGSFTSRLALTAGLAELRIVATDLYGNVNEAGPISVKPPPDPQPPTINLTSLTYGSPLAIIEGNVVDNVGVKALLLNGAPVEVYDDGSFKTKLDIQVGKSSLAVNEPVYKDGFLYLSGALQLPTFTPDQIRLEAEDFSANKAQPVIRALSPFGVEQLKLFLNDQPIEQQEGRFSTQLLLEKGMSQAVLKGLDPFGNWSEPLVVELEKVPPLLELEEPQYENGKVSIAGRAQDSLSGLDTVLINGNPVAFDQDGRFSLSLTLAQPSVTITALDRLGNATTSFLEVRAAEYPALYIVSVSPTPATVGSVVNIKIDVVDSYSHAPKLLDAPPKVELTLADASTRAPSVTGQGSSFLCQVSTTGFPKGLVKISVQGKDKAGNSSGQISGDSSFLLNTQDLVPPSFALSLEPPGPVIIGKDIAINIAVSETLKTLFQLEARLPDGNTYPLVATGSLAGLHFSARFSVPVTTSPGRGVLRISGGEDLTGNKHQTTEVGFEVRPALARKDLPLSVNFYELTAQAFAVRGNSVPNAIVHLTLGNQAQDVPANSVGEFSLRRQLSPEDLQLLNAQGSTVRLSCYATTYAGLKSDTFIADLAVPKPAQGPAGGNFTLDLNPPFLEQGQRTEFLIHARDSVDKVSLLLKLADGKVFNLDVAGAGREFKSEITLAASAAVGPAVAQIKGAGYTEYFNLMVRMASDWARRTGADFYKVTAQPDPMRQGKEAGFSVHTASPIPQPPLFAIRMPDGKQVAVTLSGSGQDFQGSFLCPEEAPLGPAELIVNAGQQDEFRRPYGVAPKEEARLALRSDLFAFTNPMPMLAGKPALVTVKSAQALGFVPVVDVRFSDGRILTVRFKEAAGKDTYSASVPLPSDLVYGPAFLVVRDDQGNVLGEFPTGVAAAFEAAGGGVQAFMYPAVALPGEDANIEARSNKPLSFVPEARLIYADGRATGLELEGPVPGTQYRTRFTIPPDANPGIVAIDILDSDGRRIGSGQGNIGRPQDGEGDVKIIITPPVPGPGGNVNIEVASLDPLNYQPAVVIQSPNKPPAEFKAAGTVPGNHFIVAYRFPADAQIAGSRIQAKDNRDQVIAELLIEGPRGEEGPLRGDLRFNPNPPVLGSPLSITLVSPMMIPFVPGLVLNLEGGKTQTVPLAGPVPGDSFSGSIARLEGLIRSVDIRDDRGQVILTIPMQMLLERPDFRFRIAPLPIKKGVATTVNMEATQDVSFTPGLRLIYPDATSINVPLNPISRRQFSGMFIPPLDDQGSLSAEVTDPEGRLIWNGSIYSAAGTSSAATALRVRVFPAGPGELALDWDVLPLARQYRIDYGLSPGVDANHLEAGNVNKALLKGLKDGSLYSIRVVALDASRNELMRSAVLDVLCGQRRENFNLAVFPAGRGQLQLNWEPLLRAARYLVRYGTAPGNYSKELDAAGATSYLLAGIDPALEYYLKVFALDGTGAQIAESNEVKARPPSQDRAGFNLFLVSTPPGEISLTWDDVEGTVGYEVDYGKNPGQYTDLLRTDKTEVVIRGLVNGIPYFARVRAIDAAGKTVANSNEITAIPGGGQGRRAQAYINVNPDPPQKGRDLNIEVAFDSEVDFYPKVICRLVNRDIVLSALGKLPSTVFQVTLKADQFTSDLLLIDVENPDTGEPLGMRSFAQGTAAEEILQVRPDPPIVGQALEMITEIPYAVDKGPRLKLKFTDGSVQDLFTQPEGALPARRWLARLDRLEKPLEAIDLIDPEGNVRMTRVFGASTTASGGCDIVRTEPGQPQLNSDLKVYCHFPQPINFTPQLVIEFVGGRILNLRLNKEGTSGQDFYGLLPASEHRENVNVIEVQDDRGATLCEKIFAPGGTEVLIDIIPSDPRVGQDLVAQVKFSQTVTYLPVIIFRLGGGIEKRPPVVDKGNQLYEAKLLARDFSQPLELIDVEDNQGRLLASRRFSMATSSSGWDVFISPLDESRLQLNWDYLEQASNYKIYYGTSSGNYNGVTSPVTVDRSITNYVLPNLQGNTDYFIKLKAYDSQAQVVAETPEKIGRTLAGKLPYPLDVVALTGGSPYEAVVTWRAVGGSAGYRIYYGRSPRVYNEGGSPKYVPGGNVIREVIGSLLNGIRYYIAVTAVDANGNESDYSPEATFTAGAGTSGEGALGIGGVAAGSATQPVIEYDAGDITPGEDTPTRTFTIENRSNEPATVSYTVDDLQNALNPSASIPAGNVHVNSSFTVGAFQTSDHAVYVSVPSTLAVGEYFGKVTFFVDKDADGALDPQESFVNLGIMIFYGTAGLDVLEGGTDFGSIQDGSTTAVVAFHVQNQSEQPFAHVAFQIPNLTNLEDRSKQILSTNINLSPQEFINKEGVLGPAEVKTCTVSVAVPEWTEPGMYGGILAVYEDKTGDDFSNDDPLGTLPMMVTVIPSHQPLEMTGNYYWGGVPALRFTAENTTVPYTLFNYFSKDVTIQNQLPSLLVNRDNPDYSIPIANLGLDSGFVIPSRQYASKSASMTIPSGLPPGIYQGEAIVAGEYQQEGSTSTSANSLRYYVIVDLGTGGLYIPTAGLSFGEHSAGGTSGELSFEVRNISTVTLDNLKVELPNLSHEQGSDMISPYHITVSNLPISLAGASSANPRVSIDIPSWKAAGRYTGTLKVYQDVNNNGGCDPGEPADELALDIEVTQAEFAVSVSFLSFGEVLQGESQASPYFSLTNNTSASHKVGSQVMDLNREGGGVLGSVNVSFTPELQELAAGASINNALVTIHVPAGQALGSYSGHIKLFLDKNDSGGYDTNDPSVDIPIFLLVDQLDLGISPSFLSFGQVERGSSSPSLPVAISNNTDTDSWVKTIVNDLRSGSNTIPASSIMAFADFNLSKGTTISKDISVEVPAGQAPGIYRGDFEIFLDVDNSGTLNGDPSQVLTIEIEVSSPGLEATVANIDLGSVERGSVGNSSAFSLTNNTNDSRYVGIVLAADLTQEGGGGTLNRGSVSLGPSGLFLASGATRTDAYLNIDVPASQDPGVYTGGVRIYLDMGSTGYDAGDPYVDVGLQIEVTTAGLEVSANALDFGALALGESGSTGSFTLTNNTGAARDVRLQAQLPLTRVGGSDIIPSDRLTFSHQGQSLGPGSQLTGAYLHLDLGPVTGLPAGAYTGTARIFLDADSSTYYSTGEAYQDIEVTVVLTTPDLQVDPSGLNLDATEAGRTSASKILRFTNNSGTASLLQLSPVFTLQSGSYQIPNSNVNFTASNLAADGQAYDYTISVSVPPLQEPGIYTGTLTFYLDEPPSGYSVEDPQVSVVLTVPVTGPGLEFSGSTPMSLGFVPEDRSLSATLEFVNNTGANYILRVTPGQSLTAAGRSLTTGNEIIFSEGTLVGDGQAHPFGLTVNVPSNLGLSQIETFTGTLTFYLDAGMGSNNPQVDVDCTLRVGPAHSGLQFAAATPYTLGSVAEGETLQVPLSFINTTGSAYALYASPNNKLIYGSNQLVTGNHIMFNEQALTLAGSGQAQEFTMSITPPSFGLTESQVFSGTIPFYLNAGYGANNPVTYVSFTLTVEPAPVSLVVSPTTLSFGSVSSGGAGTSPSLYLTNNTGTTYTVKTMAYDLTSGSNTLAASNITAFADFELAGDGVAAAKTLVIAVPSAQATGAYAGNLDIYLDVNGNNSWDSGEPKQTITLQVEVAQGLVVSTTTLDFGTLAKGYSGTSPSFSITSFTGTSYMLKTILYPLYSGSYTISTGKITPFTSFSLTGDGTPVTKTISITVPTSQATGAYTGNLDIYLDVNGNNSWDSGEPKQTIVLQVDVTGNAVEVLPTLLNFGSVVQGDSATSPSLSITNNTGATYKVKTILYNLTYGPANLAYSNITAFADFDLAGNGATATRTIAINIPSSQGIGGPYTGDFKVYLDKDNSGSLTAGDPYQLITLQITVTLEPLEVTPTALNLGAVMAADSCTSPSLTITNNIVGSPKMIRSITHDLTSGSNSLPASHIVPFTDFSLAAGTPVTKTISINVPAGQATGTYTGNLEVYIDADDSGSYTPGDSLQSVALQVEVTGTAFSVSPATLDFGSVMRASSTTLLPITVTSNLAGPYEVRVQKSDLHSGASGVLSFSCISGVDGPVNLAGTGTTGNFYVMINIPATQSEGTYTGSLTIYRDSLDNDSFDSGQEFSQEVGITVTVKRQYVASLTAVDRGTGGTVDLYWTDPNSDTTKYDIYYRKEGESFPAWGSPNRMATRKAIQVTGLENTKNYDFVVRTVGSLGQEDDNTSFVSVIPTLASEDKAPPTFAGVKRAYATAVSGEVKLEWDQAQDQNTSGLKYIIEAGTSPDALSYVKEESYPQTSTTVADLQNGQTHYFRVRAKDTYGNMEYNNHLETAVPAAATNHITISGAVAGMVGNPVLVKLTAYSSTDDSQINTSFSDSVSVHVMEEQGIQNDSYVLSVQDRMTGNIAKVEMVNGVGYFTVDDIEPETLTIMVEGIYSHPYSVTFNASSGGGATALVMDLSSRALSGSPGESAGAQLWVGVVDANGRLVSYAGEIAILVQYDTAYQLTFTKLQGSGSLSEGSSGEFHYTFVTSDNGQALFTINYQNCGNVTVTLANGIGGSLSLPGSQNVSFGGVDKFILASGARFALNYETIGSRIRFNAFAANSSNQLMSGYNGQATYERVGGSDNNSSSWMNPSPVQFVDGKAEFYIEDSEYEDVQFVIKDTQNPGIASDATTVSFKAEDSAAPEVLRVEADTPWIVHIYFNENIDTTNAMNKSNYSGVGNIHTVCWYEDNVTLHLENRLDLGSTQSLTIKGFTSMGDITIKDSNNNYIPSDVTKSFTVPAVDYQGQAFPNSDWLEIQAAPTSVPPDSSQTVGITLYQKNACGYLTGSNAVNRTMDVGNVTITYAHDKNGSYSGPTLVSLSGGMVQFTITVDLEAGETMSITASGGGASSNVPAVVTAQGSS